MEATRTVFTIDAVGIEGPFHSILQTTDQVTSGILVISVDHLLNCIFR